MKGNAQDVVTFFIVVFVIFAGPFLLRLIAIKQSRSIEKRRYNAWLLSEDAKRYSEYKEKWTRASEALWSAEEAARSDCHECQLPRKVSKLPTGSTGSGTD
jgi:hypothetical protein